MHKYITSTIDHENHVDDMNLYSLFYSMMEIRSILRDEGTFGLRRQVERLVDHEPNKLKLIQQLCRYYPFVVSVVDWSMVDNGDGTIVDDGYWIELEKGYINSISNHHWIHESNIYDILECLGKVYPCECSKCKGAKR